MKRILLSIIGTIAGLVALLSFKSQSKPLSAPSGELPSASLPSSSTTGRSTASSSAPSGSPVPSSSPQPTGGSPKSYSGAAVTTRYGIVQVKITVDGAKLTNVQFQQLTAFDRRSQDINSQAAPILLSETLKAQSAQIDTVSGATFTSDGYLRSLQSALNEAGLK